jgi:1,2-diacylglycerol-3-alpha-glucose alpha-1,2-glucosyltransferase
MRVGLYFELGSLWQEGAFRRIGTGIASSYRNQITAWKTTEVELVEGPRLDVDVLILNTPWLRSRRLMRRAQQKKIPVLVYSHTTAEDAKGVFPAFWLWGNLYRRYLRSVYRKADVVLCPSPYTRELMISTYNVKPDRAFAVSNGVDTSKFAFDSAGRERVRAELGIGQATLVGTLGLAVPRKGLSTFRELALKTSRAFFVWFGAGKKSSGRPQAGGVWFAGFVARDQINAYLSALDIFVFASHEENQGIAPLEAASLGRPIILRDLPAYRGSFVHQQNCLIAKKEQEFPALLSQLMADQKLRSRLGEAAREMVARHSISAIGQQLHQIATDVLRH